MSGTWRWRVGSHYGVHVYADPPGTEQGAESIPIATAFTIADAATIVRDHNAALGENGLVDEINRLRNERDDARVDATIYRNAQISTEAEMHRLRGELERIHSDSMDPNRRFSGNDTPNIERQ